MINAGDDFCTQCGSSAPSHDDVQALQSTGPTTLPYATYLRDEEKPSGSYYLWVLLGLIGGIIGWNLVRHRDPGMARRILLIGISISVIGIGLSIAAAVYSNSVVNSFTTPTFDTTPTVPDSTPVLSSTPAGGTAYTWTIDLTADGGATSTVQLEVGEPEVYQIGLTNGNATAGDACSLNVGTDEVVPAVVIMANTSSQAATLGLDLSGVGEESIPGFAGPELIWEANYSSGPQCTGQTDGDSSVVIYSDNEVASTADIVTDGFFEITNYSATSDSGLGTDVLGDAVITVPTTFDVNPSSSGGTGAYTDFTVTGVSGPGVEQTGSGWEFTLVGTTPPS
jgi:hypothetical protein